MKTSFIDQIEMKRIAVYLLILFFILMGVGAYAQQDENVRRKIGDNAEKIVVRSDQSIAMVKMKQGNVKNATQFINENREALGLNNESELIEFVTKTDQLGITTRKYKQYHKGVEIEGAEAIFHQKGSSMQSMNGRIVPNLSLDVNPTLSEAIALQLALDNIDATEYRWKLDGQASFQPKGLLKISSRNYSFKKEEMRLVYQFDIYATEPLARYIIEIDANTGEVVNKYDRIHHHKMDERISMDASEKSLADISASGESWYNGTVNFTADDLGSSTYILRNNAKNIHTKTLGGGKFQSGAAEVFNTSATYNDPDHKEAVSVHWATEASFDYFFDKFGISGYNSGAQILALANYGINEQNAFWDGVAFFYGDGRFLEAGNPFNINPFVTLDIVGHEYTHAITYYASQLAYQYESGALNESFSDIFGHNIEVYKNPSGWSWSNGNEVFPFGGSFREFGDPKARQQPDTYLGQYWHTTPDDNGGVHVNSGVMNYWYYLLVEGGTGINDKGFSYSVTGIGLDKAAEITYRNLSTYITANAQYTDARMGAEQSAIDLYGDGSAEHQAVIAAWEAVGVPAQAPSAYANPALDFGQVYSTFTKTLDVPVLNMGLGNLEVTNVSFDNGLFTVDQTNFTIAGNGSDTLKVTYSPTAVQSDMATMTITTDVNTITVNIDGSGVDFPIAGISPTNLSATVVSGSSTSQSFDLNNTGLGNLNWTASVPSPLSLDVSAGDISGGNSTQIIVTADATGVIAGEYTYELTIATNDSVSQQIKIPYELTVTGSPELTVSNPIDLGTVYSGVNFSRTLLIQNTGYDTMKIADIQFSIPEIELEGNTTFNIPAQSTEKVNLLYKKLPAGSLNETMTFTGNFTTENVTISGNVLSNPLMVVQDTVRITINSGESTTSAIDLTNLLGQSLEVDIMPTDTFTTSTMNYEPQAEVTQAAMLRSMDISQQASQWSNLNFAHSDIAVDVTTLNKSDITYADLQNSGADVLIIPNTLFFVVFSEAEIDAIIQYVNEGHGLVMYYGALGFNVAHNRLAPLFGLSKNATYQGTQSFDRTSVPVRTHELFENIPLPLDLGLHLTITPTIPWEDANLEGEMIARSTDEKAIVVRNFNRIYYSDWRHNTGGIQNNLQFMRNAIRMANKSLGLVSTDLANTTIAASGSQTINLTVSANGLFDGTHLYYVNIYDPANDQLIGSVPVKVDVNGISKIVAENAVTFDDTETGKSTTKSLLVENKGGADLIIDDMVFDGTNFTSEVALPFVVPAYKSSNLDLKFAPSASGAISETLVLSTNDQTTPNHVVTLNGNGLVVPHLAIGTDTIRLTMKQGTAVSKSISLENLGTVDLNWSATTSFGEAVDVIDLPDFFIDNWAGVTYLNGKVYIGHNNTGNFYTVDPFTKQIDQIGRITGSRIGEMSTDGSLLYTAVSGFGVYVYNYPDYDFQLWDYFAYEENNTLSATLKGNSWWAGPEWQGANEFYEFDLNGNKLGTYPSTSLQDIRAMDWLDNSSLLVVDHNSSTFNMKLLSFDGSQFDDTGAFDIIMPGNISDIEIQAPYVWAINYNNKLYQIHLSDNLNLTSATSGTISAGGSTTIDFSMDVTGMDPGVYPFHLNVVSNDPNAPTRIPIKLHVVEDTGGNLPPLISLSDIDMPEDGSISINLNDHIVDENSTVIFNHTVISAISDEIPGITIDDLSLGGFGTVTIQPGPGINGVFEVQVNAQDLEGNTSSAIFKVNVHPVNDAPSFTSGPDQTVANIGSKSIPGFATNILDNDHNSQTLTFIVTTDNPSLFANQPSIDANGTLTFLPKEDLSGAATVSVLLQDDGGAELGGQFQSATQTFTIQTVPGIIVRPQNTTRSYGQANPVFALTYSGFTNGDDESVLDVLPSISTSATTSSSVGTYPISLSGGSDDTYLFVLEAGTLEITPVDLTVAADNQTIHYGDDPNAGHSVSYVGFVNGDSDADLSGSLSFEAISPTDVGSYSDAIVPFGLSSDNYTITFVSGDLAIDPRPVEVTADAHGKIYGDADPILTYQVTSGSLVNSDAFSGSIGRADGENAGDYTINQGDLALNSNYALSFIEGIFTINQRPVTITADDQLKTIDGTDPMLTYQITSGELQFNDAFTGDLEREIGESAGIYQINQGTVSLGNNYDLTFVPGSFTITNKILQAITFDPISDKTYGDAVFSLNATGGPSGNPVTFVSSNPSIASVSGSTVTIHGVGVVDITASQVGDAVHEAAVDVMRSFSVNPMLLTVAADAFTKTYGDTDPIFTYQLTNGNLINGDSFTGNLSRNVGEDVGTYAIGQGTLDIGPNYSLTFVSSSLTVVARDIEVIADAASKTYGESDPLFSYQITNGSLQFDDAMNGELSREAGEDVGSYSITQGTLDAGGNYTIDFISNDLIVEAREIEITSNAASKTYGESDPLFTYQLTEGSLIAGDELTGSLERVAGEDAGNYSLLKGSLTAGTNYAETYISSKLTIEKADLTISAINATMNYGDNPQLNTSFDYTGFVNGEDRNVLDTLPVVTTTATSQSPVGLYDITLAGGNDDNYNYQLQNGMLEILPASLSVIADDQIRVYGSENPALTISYTGFVNGQDASILIELPVASTDATTTSDAGLYPISIAGGVAANYTISYESGQLSIIQAPLMIEAVDRSMNEGEQLPDLTMTFSGFANNDTENDLDELPLISTTANSSSAPGSYEIVLSQGADNNYTYTLVNGTLTINEVLGIEKKNIEVYPNPTSNYLHINSRVVSSVVIYDQSGKIVKKANAEIDRINVTGLIPGTYLIHLRDNKNEVLETARFIKVN